MSVENLKEYARRCATEPELRAKAKELGPSDVEGHMREAGGMGLDWTMDDMLAFKQEMIDAGEDIGDLSEEDLEKVTGGILSVTSAAVAAFAVGLVAAGAGVGIVAGAGVGAGVGVGAASAAAGGGW